MRTTKHSAIAVMGSICLIGSAAAEEMTGSEIKDLITGKTLYIQTTAESVTGTPGRGVIYYAPDGRALYKTPKGVMWHGTWAIRDNSSCTDWKEAPNNPCTRYDKRGATITIINLVTGQARGRILKTARGNVEKLAP
jgi:subtilisin family serine protease